MRSQCLSWTVLASLLWLTGCGGGGGAPVAGSPPPPVAEPTIGVAGGTVALADGASVSVPEGALSAAVTIRVAKDAAGAPLLPAGLSAAGNTYAITPHGSQFDRPVEVRVPAPTLTLEPDQQLKLAKAQPGGDWLVLGDSRLDQGQLVASVSSFSYFAPVLVRYLAPLTQRPPYEITSSTLDCGDQDCDRLVGVPTVTYRAASNSGQWPADCPDPRAKLFASRNGNPTDGLETDMPVAGGSISITLAPATRYYYFGVILRCGSAFRMQLAGRSVRFLDPPSYPALAVISAPQGVEVVEGRSATVSAVLAGGASKVLTLATNGAPLTFAAPTATDRAVIDWERSDDGGGSWRVVARSYQDEATPDALGSTQPWRYWSVRSSFTAAASDQGAMLRVRACYTPPDVAAPPCVTGPVTYLNVLQQTALPALTSQPRSLLVRTGQTASFGATAGGAPAPALQWQTRAANSTADWSDVSAGAGGQTGNYTTEVLTPTDNGRQFRVVARNALGSVESLPVTVSVSDADVAPALLTQPAALSVAAGGEAVFAVDARGTEALSYQWRRNGAPIAGANGAVLRLPSISTASAGDYSVVVSNLAGSVTSASATLSVGPAGTPPAEAPSITTPPVAVVVDSGNTATFGVGAVGSGPFSYQWRKDGVPLAGATAAVFTIAAAGTADRGNYSVIVTNGAGSATSPAATLTVNTPSAPVVTPPAITAQPASLVAIPGSPTTLAIAAEGSGPLNFQWAKDGSPIPGATASVLHLASVTGSDAGSYTVAVSNAAGSLTSSAATLIVVGAPVIGGQPAAQSVPAGSSATFSVSATGSSLRYQWTRNNVAIVGATEASHTTPALAVGDSGAVYAVIVYNGAGVVISSAAVLTVTAAPSLTQTQQVSLTNAGAMPSGISYRPSISADGARVAFISNGNNLIPGTVNAGHAYLRDRIANTTTRITVRPDGSESSQGTTMVKLAANGRHVVFRSRANDLVAGDSNLADDVFVRDLATQTTVRVNVLADGSQDTVSAGTTGLGADISADGRRVLMRSIANLAGDGAATAGYRWYLRDLDTGVTRLVAGSEDGQGAALSPDGRYVAFIAVASSPAQNRLMLYDDQSGSTALLLAVPSGTFPEGLGAPLAVSDDAAVIAFWLRSSSVGGGAAAQYSQIGAFERSSGSVSIASVTATGVAGDGHSSDPSVSRDGRYVSFRSAAPNLSGDPASAVGSYLMVRDRQAGTTRIASRQPDGTPFLSQQGFNENAISADGSAVVHLADAGEVVPGSLGGIQVFLGPRP